MPVEQKSGDTETVLRKILRLVYFLCSPWISRKRALNVIGRIY